ncbi:putative E3 ubiquitin-protein ligase RING1a isoform X2 [Ziziphus jujuba]|uniref:E3 ubiquitin-protein ligase RING1a isoform X2 n=1 Tax=Ziziphus jujuba TaxID=326968 RepID=A0ABM3IG18_ZIZJJ|nr:putative E3 ubiquitin-protein ligase RING1a isoform X2 [Ziziphus jujuba]
MPAHKRSLHDNLSDDEEEPTNHHHRPKQSRPQPQPQDEAELLLRLQEQKGKVVVEGSDDDEDEEEDDEEQVKQDEEEDGAEDSVGSPSSSSQERPEFVSVELPDLRKDVQCPICLGIIKKTRTVMECLHRFCRECIDKSMRLGNNECPACRTHCASRRSLRDDPNYDALIAALYPDIEKYEEEELAFHEEETTRNKQVFQRQSEALNKRRSLGKDSTDTFTSTVQRNHRNGNSRRRNARTMEFQASEDNEDDNVGNNIGKDSSSTDERRLEIRQKRRKRRGGIQSSSSVANLDGGNIENDLEVSRENHGISLGTTWSEMLAWGGGGARSNTRHGNANGYNSKSSRSTRLSKLVDYLRSLEEHNDELDVHLMLISLDKKSTPSLQQPHLCCRPSLSVKHLCEYVARQTPLQAEEVELLALRGRLPRCQSNDEKLTLNPSTSINDRDLVSLVINPCSDDLQILEAEETLAGIKASCPSSRDHLILLYRQKASG